MKTNRLVILISGICLALTLVSCAHPNAALGEFRGKYVRAGFMLNDSSWISEIVLTSRGEVFTTDVATKKLKKDKQLNKLKTKAVMLAVEKSGILVDHKNTTGAFSTFYVEYHKRKKVYRWTWGEFNWPAEIKDVYKDLEATGKTD